MGRKLDVPALWSEQMGAAVAKQRELAAELTELTERGAERAAEAEALRAALAQIEQVDPQPGEDVALAQRAERLANAEELRQAAAIAHDALSGDGDTPDVGILLAEARRALDRAARGDETLAAHAATLDDLRYQTRRPSGSRTTRPSACNAAKWWLTVG